MSALQHNPFAKALQAQVDEDLDLLVRTAGVMLAAGVEPMQALSNLYALIAGKTSVREGLSVEGMTTLAASAILRLAQQQT
jgi:hypothetical protein